MRCPLAPRSNVGRLAAIALAMCGVVIAPAIAGATSLVWQAPAGCPDERVVMALVEAQLGRKLASGWGDLQGATATVSKETGGFRVDLRMATPDGTVERHMKAEDCALVAEGVAAAMAQVIDPRRGKAAPASADLARTSTTPALPRRPWNGVAALSLGGDVGTLPTTTAGIRGALAAVWPRLRLELEGAFWAARDAALSRDPSRGGSIGLWSVTGRPCFGVPGRTARIDGCLGLAIGRMYGDSYGLATPIDGGGALYLATEQSVVARMRAGATPVSLFAGLAALENLQRPRFLLRGLGEVHRPSALSLQLLVGAEARLF